MLSESRNAPPMASQNPVYASVPRDRQSFHYAYILPKLALT